MNKSVVAFLLLGLSACAGKLEYTPPIGNGNVVTQISVDKSKTELWDSVIASLSKDFFVINNIEKDSGFINVSYSGAPSSFIDCGEISSYVKNAAGERTYRFGGEKENQIYELTTRLKRSATRISSAMSSGARRFRRFPGPWRGRVRIRVSSSRPAVTPRTPLSSPIAFSNASS